ncbi:hypothetical protein R1sor_023197 [Riccia sorocarpa]|uniref:NADH dehydrogenase subunit 6 n=1 Tax=Riccia sorocarpa TaxID=122646 RepID=A0ABD3GNI5_9MARC
MCANVWASVVGFAAGILFLIVGILALVPASPFSHRERTLGIALVVLGATGVASYAGTIVGCVSGLGIGFCLDKTYANKRMRCDLRALHAMLNSWKYTDILGLEVLHRSSAIEMESSYSGLCEIEAWLLDEGL